MKVGILTFHRAHNYGAVLQCYALQEVLKGMGHDVEVIDYRQPWTELVYKRFSLELLNSRCHSLKKKIRYIFRCVYNYHKIGKTRKIFSDFRNKYLKLSPIFRDDTILKYDFCIIGSDQLWGINCLGGQCDKIFTGNLSVSSKCKIVGYAISSNLYSIDYMQQHNILENSLNNFSSISFREESVISKIADYTNQYFQECVDPTLLTEKENWNFLLNDKWKNRKYVVCYRARSNGSDGFSLEETTKRFAEQNKCEVIDLSDGQYSVNDFVSAIANAQYVLTTSFHASVFSLIFNRPLAAYMLHDGHDSRYTDLLKKIDASFFLYETADYPLINPICNWNRINDKLSEYKNKSKEFLKSSIV